MRTEQGLPHLASGGFSEDATGAGAAGVVCLALGYWLLARGSITAAPILLVLAYVVLLPLAIIK